MVDFSDFFLSKSWRQREKLKAMNMKDAVIFARIWDINRYRDINRIDSSRLLFLFFLVSYVLWMLRSLLRKTIQPWFVTQMKLPRCASTVCENARSLKKTQFNVYLPGDFLTFSPPAKVTIQPNRKRSERIVFQQQQHFFRGKLLAVWQTSVVYSFLQIDSRLPLQKIGVHTLRCQLRKLHPKCDDQTLQGGNATCRNSTSQMKRHWERKWTRFIISALRRYMA